MSWYVASIILVCSAAYRHPLAVVHSVYVNSYTLLTYWRTRTHVSSDVRSWLATQ